MNADLYYRLTENGWQWRAYFSECMSEVEIVSRRYFEYGANCRKNGVNSLRKLGLGIAMIRRID